MQKRFILLIVLIATLSPILQAVDFPSTLISGTMAGNNRFPGFGENDRGERLAIWRSHNRGMAYSFYKNETWSEPRIIPHQIEIDGRYLGSDIIADSEGRFHAVWELMDEAAFYASFKDGVWTDPQEIPFGARYEGFQIGLDIRSNDEVVLTACCIYKRIFKDCVIGFKNRTETNFGRFINVTDDRESSSSPSIAVDADDNIWLTWKGEEFGHGEEVLLTCVMMIDKNNNVLKSTFKGASREQLGWSFLPWIACNKNGMVMVVWWNAHSFYSRWYNTNTKVWSPLTIMQVHSIRHGDFSMWSKVVAHGNDFYFLGKNSGHLLHLIKFNTSLEKWETPQLVTKDMVQYFDIFPGYDKVHLIWGTRGEPTKIYSSFVEVEPQITVKSAQNVQSIQKMERSFFRYYYFNQISWENNQFNIDRHVDVQSYNLYRKLKSEALYSETPLKSNIPVDITTDMDLDIDPLAQYDYYVTCVALINGKEVESKIQY